MHNDEQSTQTAVDDVNGKEPEPNGCIFEQILKLSEVIAMGKVLILDLPLRFVG